MQKIKLKNNKGFTTVDISISIIIIILFVSIISTAYYNYYISITRKNREAQAINTIIDIIESIEKMNYEEITQDEISKLIEELKNGKITNYGNKITIPNGYEVTVIIEKYNETLHNEDKKDLIKKINVKIEYQVGNKTEKIEINKLITKNDILK